MRRFNSYSELKECFNDLVLSNSSDLGLAPSEILFGTHKAKAPYITTKYRPIDEMQSTGTGNLHKMLIYVVIVIGYQKDNDLLEQALSKASVIENICLANNFTYLGHQEGITADMLESDKQTEYCLICECMAYYRNVK